MTISVVIAVHNGVGFLEQQINSILNQTVTVDEIVICNDFSSDSSHDLIHSISNGNSSIVYIENSQNLGVVKTFEKALTNIRPDAEYIFLADQDDLWKKNKVDTMILECNDNLAVASDLVVVDRNLNKISNSFFKYTRTPLNKSHSIISVLLKNPAPGCSIMIRKEILSTVLPFPNGLIMHDWWIILIASNLRRFKIINKPLVYYRQHSDNQLGIVKNSFSGLQTRIKKLNGLTNYVSYREARRATMISLLLKQKSSQLNLKDALALKKFYGISGFKRLISGLGLFVFLAKKTNVTMALKESIFYIIKGVIAKK